MSDLAVQQILRKRLVENIAMLWTLGDVPEQPKENGLCDEGDEGDEIRQLSAERERQLADSFAFLSATTDNMRRVVAVCIEEHPDQKGMTIRLAANTGDLSITRERLQGITKTLERAALRGNSVCTDSSPR